MNFDKLLTQIERHEGFRDTMYSDSVGVATIGVGHNLRDVPMDRDVLQLQAKLDLLNAIMDVRDLCEQFEVKWSAISEPRQHALIDMSFNLGKGGLSGFPRMWAAIHKGDWDEAADQALDSKWARQVGVRAGTIASQFRNG